MQKLVTDIKEYLPEMGLRIVIAFAVLIIGFKLVRPFIKLIKKNKAFSKMQKTAQGFILSFLSVVLKIAIAFAFVAILGIPMTTMIALVTSAGVAIGLALQGSLSNFCGGLMILIFKPFVVGDFIIADNCRGFVQNINIFYTTLCDYNNVVTTIPNSTLSNTKVNNEFLNEYRRVEIPFSISYKSSIAKAREIILQTALNNPKIVSEYKGKQSKAVATALNQSSVEITLKAWCKSDDYWEVFFYLNQEVKKELEQNGLEIPFPQMDVHIDTKR